MALSKKPIKNISPAVPNVDVEALINKGGGVPKKTETPTVTEKVTGRDKIPRRTKADIAIEGKKLLDGGKVPVQLRISPNILDEIDALIAKRKIPCARHEWFMAAISEKMAQEMGE